jgi:putative aminopeptidase FrvX
VTNASDDPSVQKKKQVNFNLGTGRSISSGPNTRAMLRELLLEAAHKHKIPYQLALSTKLESNDAKEMQVAKAASP